MDAMGMAMKAAGTTAFPVEAAGTPSRSNHVVLGSVDFNSRPAVRSETGRWKSTSFIIGVELAEKIAFFGIVSNLISYLTGPLGQPTAAAAANVNTWSGAAWLLPLVGGFIADSYLGRYRMILAGSLLCILGLGFLSLSAALHSGSPSPGEVVFFIFSLYLVAFSQGGIKPCTATFGADQFDEGHPEESIAKSSFFNWWNFSSVGVTVLSVLILNYVQDNLSWELAFGIPCIIMCFAMLVFLLGTKTYRFSASRPRQDSQLSTALLGPDNLEEDGNPHAVLGLASVWITCLGYSAMHSQISTLFVKQAATMDRRITPSFQIPVASIQSSAEVAFFVTVPIYDRILVPVARRMTKRPTGISSLPRIGTGIFMSLLAMTMAALVEQKRLAVAIEYVDIHIPNATVPMSVWWLAPQNIAFGVADVFVLVGLQQFFYDGGS